MAVAICCRFGGAGAICRRESVRDFYRSIRGWHKKEKKTEPHSYLGQNEKKKRSVVVSVGNREHYVFSQLWFSFRFE